MEAALRKLANRPATSRRRSAIQDAVPQDRGGAPQDRKAFRRMGEARRRMKAALRNLGNRPAVSRRRAAL
jgi:hypothetical protein